MHGVQVNSSLLIINWSVTPQEYQLPHIKLLHKEYR